MKFIMISTRFPIHNIAQNYTKTFFCYFASIEYVLFIIESLAPNSTRRQSMMIESKAVYLIQERIHHIHTESSCEWEISLFFAHFICHRTFLRHNVVHNVLIQSENANEMFANPSCALPNAITTSSSSSSPKTPVSALSEKTANEINFN